MLPNMFIRPFKTESLRKKKEDEMKEMEWMEFNMPYYMPYNKDCGIKTPPKLSLHSDKPSFRSKSIKKMATKISNISDLMQRVTSSCLLNPISSRRHDDISSDADYSDDNHHYKSESEPESDDDDVFQESLGVWEPTNNNNNNNKSKKNGKEVELEMMMGEVFDAVSNMKAAYVSLQDAHCPWDADKMRVADVSVVSELRRLGVLRERFRRSVGGGGGGGRGRWRVGAATLREVVAPYEAAVQELKSEVKAKDREIASLQEKLKTTSSSGGSGKKGSSRSRRKVSCISQQVAVAPGLELFETTMGLVTETSKSFTSTLLSLMRSAHWDIAAAVRSIEAASFNTTTTSNTVADSIVGANHSKYAFESYVNRKIFQGFDHESFYMDGSLSSLLNPDQHRSECFTQYRDMKAMDPVELLSILPTCSFGNFCFKKFLAIVHPKMEESLFGDLEQRRQVLAGHHPRSQFYGEFLGLAKAVWLLHLLAFSLEKPPSHFEAARGAEFHSQYMESVVRISGVGGGGRLGVRQVVGFPVSPGFKLGNGSVIKARVYLVPKDEF